MPPDGDHAKLLDDVDRLSQPAVRTKADVPSVSEALPFAPTKYTKDRNAHKDVSESMVPDLVKVLRPPDGLSGTQGANVNRMKQLTEPLELLMSS